MVVLGAHRRLIGIFSEREIVRAFAELGADALTKRLAQAMTREVATCGAAETPVSIIERSHWQVPTHARGRARSTGRQRVDRRHRQTHLL